ncbi:MAG: PKD domain-containing protein [Bacteroidetes bacterium]|nr:PKD domain-containing protein [Bacteroidota bacterium]
MKPITNHFKRIFICLSLAFAFSFIHLQQAFGQSPQTYSATGAWVCPAGVSTITVEAWGGGGAGGGNTTNADGGGGGGGGGYSKSTTVAVTSGTSYTVTVGTGGTGSTGNGGPGLDSWFSAATGVLTAKGGGGGFAPAGGNGGVGGAGGVLGTGTTRFVGGSGGTGINNNNGRGGPGGSSAGTAANGTSGPGTWSTITAAAAPTNGGKGGNGGDGTDGSPGSVPGGGGGGSDDGTRSGGDGADGRVIITWTCPAAYALTSAATATGPICPNGTSVVTLRSSSMATGTYTVTYSTTNPATSGNTATMSFTAGAPGTGSFTTIALPATSTITVTNLASGNASPNNCNSNTAVNNTATVTVTAPTTQATIGAFTATTAVGTTVNWTRGNGTGGVIVVARLTATGNVTPTGGVSYTANSVFGSGNTTGAGNFVVYNGTGTSVAVTGLAILTGYTFIVYEYNSGTLCYNTTGSSATVTTAAFTWTGGTSIDWATGSNWNTLTVPTASDNIIIGTGTFQPTISAAAVCNNITLNNTTTLIVNSTLGVSGNWTNNGSTVSGSGTVTLSGTCAIGGTATTSFPNLTCTGTISQGINTTVSGDFLQSAGTYNQNNGATAFSLIVTGGFTLSGSSSFFMQKTSTGLGATTTVNGAAGTTISGTATLKMDDGGAAVANVSIFQTTNYTASSTSNRLVDFGNNGTAKSNQFRISGNYVKTGTGACYTSGTPINGGFFFNGGGVTQTFSTSATVQPYTSFTVNSGSVLQLLTNLPLGANTNPVSIFTVNGKLDCGALAPAISGGAATGCAFVLASGGTLVTANVNGVVSGTTGSISTSVNTRTFNNAANYIFNGTANQNTAFATTTMNDLTITNTGAVNANKVTLTGAATVNGNLAIDNGVFDAAAIQIVGNATPAKTFTIASGATFRMSGGTTLNFPTLFTTSRCVFNAASTVEYYGATQTISGTPAYGNLTISTAGTKTAGAALTVAGDLRINTTATTIFAASTFTHNIAGNWINNGAFTAGTSTINFNGTSVISGASTNSFNNLTVTGTLSGPAAANINVAANWVNNGTFTHNSGTVTFNGTSVMSGSSTTSFNNLTIAAASSLTGPLNATMNVAGNWTNGNTFTSNGGTVNLNGGASQTIGGTASTTFNDLTLSNSFGAVLGAAQSIAGTLTLSSGRLNLSTFNLTLGAAAVAGTLNSSNMIIASGGGELRRTFTANGSYLYPVGDDVGTIEYSPITLAVTGGPYSNAYLAIKVTNTKHPNNQSTTNFLNRFWSITQAGVTSCAVIATATYTGIGADIAGTEASISGASLTGTFVQASNPWVKYSALGSNTLTTTSVSISAALTTVVSGITGANPSVSITGGGVTVCTGTNVNLGTSFTGDATATYSWSPATFLSSTTIANPVVTAPTATTIYTVTAKDGNGLSTTASTTITVNDNPTGALAGPDQTDINTCGLTTVTLAANTALVGMGSWTIQSGSGGSFIDATSPTTDFNGTAGTSYILRWTISNAPCADSFDEVSITFNQNPTAAAAGPDQISNLTCGLTSATLAANAPSIGTGAWSIQSGAGGSFSLASDPLATFSGTAGISYVLRWTISNAPCTDNFDEVTITFNQNPTAAAAGPDQIDNLTCGLTSVTLAANAPSVGTGAWSIQSGTGGSFSLASDPLATFSGTAGTSYVLRWTISNAPCTDSFDEVSITFNQNPTTAAAGPDQIDILTCGLTSVTLAANVPSDGIGAWSIQSGAGGSFSLDSDPSSTFSGTAGTSYVLRWTISNAPCADSFDEVTITFNQNPTGSVAGSNQTFCNGSFTTLAANAPSIGTGAWSIQSGPSTNVVQFSSVSDPAATFTPSGGIGTYVLVWTISNNPCTASSSSLNVLVTAGPWIGGVSDDWANPLNWCGGVPTAITNVVISNGAPNYPKIYSGAQAANSISISSGGSLIISGGSLASGPITTAGPVTIDAGATLNMAANQITGSGSVTINGTFGTSVADGFSGSATTGIATGISFTTGAASTIDYTSASSQTITAYDYANLSSSGGGDRLLDNSDNIGVSGDFTPGASNYDVSNSTVVFNGSALQTVPALLPDSKYYDIEIDNPAGAEMDADLNLIDALYLTDGAFTTTGFNFTLLSTATNTARIDVIAGGTIVGDVVMQRFIPAGRTNWSTIGMPVTNATLAQWQDDFATSGYTGSTYGPGIFNSVYTYDESIPGLVDNPNAYIQATNVTNTVDPKKGYYVWLDVSAVNIGSKTIDVKGEPLMGTQPLNPTFTASAGLIEDGWNLLNNPYCSAIDWDSPSWTKTNVDNAIYVYDRINDYYASYVGPIGMLPGVGTNGGTNIIASSQAFLIHANATSPVLTAEEDIKVGNNATFYKVGNTTATGILRLKLNALNGTYFDETVLRAGDGATSNFDADYDARKLISFNAAASNISSKLLGVEYAINSVDELSSNFDLPIRVKVNTAGTHTISFVGLQNFANVSCLTFEDKLTNTTVDLHLDSSYTFASAIDTASSYERFTLHFGIDALFASMIPSTNAVSLPGNTTVNFTNTSTGASTYSWDFGDGSPIETTENPSHTFSAVGTYNVSLTVSNNAGCSAPQTSTVQIVVDDVTGVNAVAAAESVTLTKNEQGLLANYNFKNATKIKVNVYDALGKQVGITQTIVAQNAGKSRIEMPELAKGIYTIELVFDAKKVSRKMEW